MKVVALMKTFDGEEWIEASLASIYDAVDLIVMAHSDKNWAGEDGNTALPVIKRWQKKQDAKGKLQHVFGTYLSQDQQYRAGLEFLVKKRISADILMLVDADEIWDPAVLERAIRQIEADSSCTPAYQTRMHSYIRSPLYRISPPFGTPTVFLREGRFLTESPRAWKAEPIKTLNGIWFHHMTYVRASPEIVRRKIVASSHADGEGTRDLDLWFAEKWDRLPEAEYLHPFLGRDQEWGAVEVIRPEILPSIIRHHPLVLEAMRNEDYPP